MGGLWHCFTHIIDILTINPTSHVHSGLALHFSAIYTGYFLKFP